MFYIRSRPYSAAFGNHPGLGQMSPRVIHIPVSGRDRRNYARELRKGEEIHASLVRRVADANKVADEYRRMADRLACEEWTARMFIGGEVGPSPTLQVALDCGCVLLRVECRGCGHARAVDLREVIWPRDKQVHTLERVLRCTTCASQGNRKVRPNLMGFDTIEPDPDDRRSRVARR
ncbi:hypothetical protein AFEL58S_02027 [Afipia felis]